METPKHSSDNGRIGEALLRRIPTPVRHAVSQLREYQETQMGQDTSPSRERLLGLALPIGTFVAFLFACTLVTLLFSSSLSNTAVAPSSPIEPTPMVNALKESPEVAGDRTSLSGLPTEMVTPATALEPSLSELPAKVLTSSSEALTGRATTSTSAPSKPVAHEPTTQAIAVVAEPNSTIEQHDQTIIGQRIESMWSEGRVLLQQSKCQEAEQLMANALELLDEAMGNATSDPTISRTSLESDRAVAMICLSRFKVGAEILGQQTMNDSSVHMNALGYAHYMLKDYQSAGSAFVAGLKADPFNSMTWSNLAASRLRVGDIKAADDAMYNALDPDIVSFHSDPRSNGIFLLNVNIIAQHAIGKKSQHPWVELWYAAN